MGISKIVNHSLYYLVLFRNEEFMKQLQIAKRDLYNAEETRKLTKASMILQEVTALKEKLRKLTKR